MSIVANIRHIKVLVSKSQVALPIDFSIKCLFCLWLSIIVAVFTLRLQHLVFLQERERVKAAPFNRSLLWTVDHWFLSRPSALMALLMHTCTFSGSAWPQTQTKFFWWATLKFHLKSWFVFQRGAVPSDGEGRPFVAIYLGCTAAKKKFGHVFSSVFQVASFCFDDSLAHFAFPQSASGYLFSINSCAS